MKRIILIAAACAALASCTKAETEIVNVTEPVGGTSFEKGQTVTLNVNTGTTTKVTSELNADGQTVDFKWDKGDKILVKVGEASAVFTLKEGEGTSSASFEGIMPASGDKFDVQYPVTDPDIATQNYSSTEAIPHDKMKFTATGCPFASPSFTLTAANAALRLNLYGTDQTISKIVVKDASSNAYTLDISPAVKLPAEKKDSMAFFIVVPAKEYKFSAEIFDNASTPASICNFEPSAAQIFTAGNVLNMPANEVKKPLPTTKTITWDKTNFPNVKWTDDIIRSVSLNDVTLTSQYVDFQQSYDIKYGGSFTTELGKFTSIVVNAQMVLADGSGWSGNTWTGNASSVSFNDAFRGVNSITFTIQLNN